MAPAAGLAQVHIPPLVDPTFFEFSTEAASDYRSVVNA
jgi:hypothetical protein